MDVGYGRLQILGKKIAKFPFIWVLDELASVYVDKLGLSWDCAGDLMAPVIFMPGISQLQTSWYFYGRDSME